MIPKGLGTEQDLLKRFKKAEDRFEMWRSLHQEAMDYSCPNRETFNERSAGQTKDRHIFDSTAVVGLSQFANRIQAALVPSWQQWARIVTGSEVPAEDAAELNPELEIITNKFFDALNHSNFSTEISPSLIDLGIGTGAILLEEGEFKSGDMFRFTNIPLAELYPERPPNGPVESAWRKQEIELAHVTRVWPKAKLPDKLAEKAKKDPYSKETFLNGMLFNPTDKKYHQIVMHEASKSVVFTQSFNKKRLIVFRWQVTPNEVFGRGPVIQQIADIRTLNKVKEFVLQNAALQIAGVYTGVDDGIFNPHTFQVKPGIINPVSSNDINNPSIRPLERAGDIGLSQFVMNDLQDGIKKALMSEPLGDVTDAVKSATEQQIRQNENLKDRGSSFGRLKTELVEPLIAAGMDILKSRGVIPDLKLDGKEVTIRHTSPLAKSEDVEDFQNIQIWLQTLMGMLPPEMMALAVKMEDVPRFMQEKLGLPATLVRTPEESNAMMQKAQQEAEAQQEAQGGQQQQPV